MANIRIPLAEIELSRIKAQLDGLSQRRTETQRIIDDMQRLKDAMDLEAQELEREMRELEMQLVPANWLPNEILSRIFVMVNEYDLDTIVEAPNTDANQPVILSHVCSRWRQLALAQRELWNLIHLRAARYRGPLGLRHALSAYVERSGGLPLDVVFVAPPHMEAIVEVRLINRLIELVNKPRSQMKSLVVRCENELAMTDVFQKLDLRSADFRPSLEHLDLALASTSATSSVLGIDLQSREAATLLKSTLANLRLERVQMRFLPSWTFTSLRCLRLSYPQTTRSDVRRALRMSDLRAALACSGQLEQLCLSDAVPAFDVSPDRYNELLALQRVRHFEWSYPRFDDVQRLLCFFDFPALTELDISVVPSIPVETWIVGSTTTQWVQPVGYNTVPLPNLQTLTLTCLDNSTCTLRQCVLSKLRRLEFIGGTARLDYVLRDPRLPHLTHLLFADVNIDSGNAGALLGYVPQLESLTLERVTHVDALLLALRKTSDALVQDALGNFVQLRSMPCPQLVEIILWCCSDVTARVLIETVRCRNEEEPEANSTPYRFGRPTAGRLVKQIPGKRSDVVTQRPCKITSVRVEGCRGVTPHSSAVSTLLDLGVQDATVVCGDEGAE
ncbi:hypothetical protein BD626DRAFT_633986 [Schizophyllum amplum]|uniref:Uncharacterized protein n=1 Tax=Schizophyllum amplum TaxID=97359 RepID=A0A550C134_9AGAR|nr:hypothetical protein BD626DRAFT_633986 [Auriculariopsis ampla]